MNGNNAVLKSETEHPMPITKHNTANRGWTPEAEAALRKIQKSTAPAAKRLGIKTDEDIIAIIKEVRKERWNTTYANDFTNLKKLYDNAGHQRTDSGIHQS
jgi:hypothetical protein